MLEKISLILKMVNEKRKKQTCFWFLPVNKMSLVMRKPAFCICENKDADQLRSNREADQRLCFHYIKLFHYLLNPKFQTSSHLL